MKQLEITLRARNNLLIQRRVEMGLHSQADAARAMKLAVTTYNGYETFRTSPLTEKGEWKLDALRIADFHGVLPGTLWPTVLREIKERKFVVYGNVAELGETSRQFALPADARFNYNEFREVVAKRIDGLTPTRDQAILRMKFGFGPYESPRSLDEIAGCFGITRERVRQILSRALMHLRVPELAEWHRDEIVCD